MLGAIEEGLRDHLERLRECHACANPKCITPTFWRVSDTSVNAVLAFIEGAAPRDEVEAALAIQMACTYAVTMAVLSRLDGAFGGDRGMAIRAAAAARLLKAFATQVEALRRFRNGGSQFVRVEHVHVNDGGRAIVGNVSNAQGSA